MKVTTARENLGPEAHGLTNPVENPKKWLGTSHVVRPFGPSLGVHGGPRGPRGPWGSNGTKVYISRIISFIDRSFVLNSSKYFIPILIITLSYSYLLSPALYQALNL